MTTQHYIFLENVRFFRDFRKIREIEIKLAKRNPPMGADIDSAGVEMHCTRD